VTDNFRVLIRKSGGTVDMAIVTVRVDDGFDRFLIEDVIQVRIEGG
jgi:hypothetical protein